MSVSIPIPRPECTLFIPIEVCENIIDMMYSAYFSEELGNFAALRRCSLVCRAWSIRAQKVLFYTVHLPDAPSVYRFAAVLQAAPRLSSFVHEVTLIGRSLHTTASVLSLFPAVFAGKLPNLQELYITHVLESDAWYPTGSDSPKAKPLPYVPLHSCFSAVLSTFTAPSTLLHLDRITFCSFSEFARMVHALPNLEELRCYSIKWITLGRLPSFMAHDRRRHFAPKLQTLEFADSSIYGAERLISACGPQLKKLDIGVPLQQADTSLDVATASSSSHGTDSDLSLCVQLKDLTIQPTEEFLADPRHGAHLRAMLSSWKPRHPDPHLTLGVFYNTEVFTQQEYADLLRALGAIVEDWLREVQATEKGTSTSGHAPRLRYWVVIVLYDWEAQRVWWQAHLDASFPTWSKLGRLKVDYRTPQNSDYRWKPNGNSSEPTPEASVQQKDHDDGGSTRPED